MGAPYTVDLRERVVAAFRSGLSRHDTATRFQVSQSSVQRWSRLDREKGSVAAQPIGQQPDLPLRELLAELRDRGVKVSYFAVWNIIDRAGLSVKKKPVR